jgi:hypothetical protein
MSVANVWRLLASVIPKVFAKPISLDGLRVLTKSKFKNVLDSGRPVDNVACCKHWKVGVDKFGR